MERDEQTIAGIAARTGLSEGAVRALSEALSRGVGGAQWSHPELGGMGQWSGGMLQIGDMFNDALKARVREAIEALASRPTGGAMETSPQVTDVAASGWWPETLGRPASSGGQNGMRYASCPQRNRLAVDRDGQVTVYDTGGRHLTGVSQMQGTTRSLRFSGPDGEVSIDDLAVAR